MQNENPWLLSLGDFLFSLSFLYFIQMNNVAKTVPILINIYNATAILFMHGIKQL